MDHRRVKRTVLVALALLVVGVAGVCRAADRKPNIVVIYADDLGYGDVGCYGATKVTTPNIDRLASEGLRFTDAHATASTCTPSRYSILTGQYAWRKKGTNILPGDASLIIDPSKPTTASVLKSAGYTTGAVGKWHLGLGKGRIDWNGEVAPGPLEVGFDFSWIFPATPDRVPCVYMDGHRVVNLDPNDPITVSYKHKVGDWPTGREHPELLKMKASHGHDGTIINGIGRIGWMTGGKSALWQDDTIAMTFTAHAIDFIEKNKDRPFFLYFCPQDIHVPRVPNKKFVGTSRCGVRGDSVEELDWVVGQVMSTLDRLNLTNDTLVIFTSDNGPVVDDGYADGSVIHLNGHKPAGPLRGGKYTSWEGGTREPFIVHWPGHVKPGVSDALVCQVDLLSSMASLAGAKVPAGGGPDSFNVLTALLGQSATGRATLVEQGNMLSLREGKWKLMDPTRPVFVDAEEHNEAKAAAAANRQTHMLRPGSKKKRPGQGRWNAKPMLFDLSKDLGEQHDVAAEHPEVVTKMMAELESIRHHPLSRPE